MTCLYGVADHYMPYQVIKDGELSYLKSEGRMPVGVRVPPPNTHYKRMCALAAEDLVVFPLIGRFVDGISHPQASTHWSTLL